MYFGEKIKDINSRLQPLGMTKCYIIWGVGEHTSQLLLYTELSKLWDKAVLVDKNAKGRYFAGKEIFSPDDIEWHTQSVEMVLISSFKWRNNIEESLRSTYQFKNTIIQLYSEDELDCFYHLYHHDKGISYGGNFQSWAEAAKLCGSGYQTDNIFTNVFRQTLSKKDVQPVNHYLLYYCMKHYLKHNSLYIIDYGGGSAVQYWGVKKELHKIVPNFKWFIKEQPQMVSLGKKYFSEQNLVYADSLSDIKKELGDAPCLIYINAVLQYLPAYEDELEELFALNTDLVVMERLLMGEKKRIIVQHVHDYIYEASYPAYIFDHDFYTNCMSDFCIVYEEETSGIFLSDLKAVYKKAVFERKKTVCK